MTGVSITWGRWPGWNPVAAMFYKQKAGQIVGISSVAGERGRVGNPSYNASKAALNCFMESLRNRLTRRGVHMLTVKPGYVLTEMASGLKNRYLPSRLRRGCRYLQSHPQA